MKYYFLGLLPIVIALTVLLLVGDVSFSRSGTKGAIISEITADGAYCWFADPRALRFVSEDGEIDKIFLGWIDRKGNVKACQYDNRSKKRQDVTVRENLEADDHDTPTFLILPDNHVMIFYTKHTNERKIWYRVSLKPGDITELGEEKWLDTDHDTTYPNPFILADDQNHIYLAWRGIAWHPTIARLDMPTNENGYTTKFVEGPYRILHSSAQQTGVQGTSCRPYAKYASDGKNRIYVAFSATHPDNINPTMLYGVYVDIRDLSVHDLNGGLLDDDLSKDPIFTVTNKETRDEHPEYVLADSKKVRHWVWDATIGKDGSFHVLFTKISNDKTKHEYFHGKWWNGKWKVIKLADAGGWFHQNPGTEKCYSAGMSIDPNNPNTTYMSVPGKDAYEIVRIEISANATDITKTKILTSKSEKNNVRPYVIPGPRTRGVPYLIWMYGDYYYWAVKDPNGEKQGYYTGIRTNAAFPEEITKSEENPQNEK